MKKFAVAGRLFVASLLGLAPHYTRAADTAYDFSFPALAGPATIALDQFQGKVLLIVNTASRCGFTGQYEALQRLTDRYAGRPFAVIGVPSDDFGGQEPDDETTIRHFCTTRFGVTFPMTGKVSVKGTAAHPFYRWAAAQAGMWGAPKWNFHKYLIAPDGRLADWFASTTAPDSAKITDAIDHLLPGDQGHK